MLRAVSLSNLSCASGVSWFLTVSAKEKQKVHNQFICQDLTVVYLALPHVTEISPSLNCPICCVSLSLMPVQIRTSGAIFHRA